jgi:hypothetical protein
MNRLRQILFRLQPFLRRRKIEATMSEEIRLHLEMQTEANLAAGMSPEEARYAARREFGGVDQVKEAWRDERTVVWLENGLRDVRFAARSLVRNPAISLAAVLTLALGLTVNATLFSFVNELFLGRCRRPTPAGWSSWPRRRRNSSSPCHSPTPTSRISAGRWTARDGKRPSWRRRSPVSWHTGRRWCT